MHEVFRFVSLRPPQKPRFLSWITLSLDRISFGQRLLALRNGEKPRTQMLEAARAFLESAEFTKDLTQLPLHSELLRFHDTLTRQSIVALFTLMTLIQDIFGDQAQAVIQTTDFSRLRINLIEGVLALKLRPDLQPRLLAEYVRLLRLMDIIERVARQDNSLDGQRTATLMHRIVQLPSELFPLPRDKEALPEQPANNEADERNKAIKALQTKIKHTEAAITELLSFSAADLTVPVPTSSSDQAVSQQLARLVNKIGSLETTIDGLRVSNSEPLDCNTTSAPSTSAGSSIVSNLSMAEPSRTSSNGIVDNPDAGFRSAAKLKPSAIERLSPATKETLTAIKANPETTPVRLAIAQLETESARLAEELGTLEVAPKTLNLIRIGGTTLPVSPASVSNFPELASQPPIPSSVGLVRPAYVGNLLVVLMQILRYEASEIAHVENVLQSESRQRETRRLSRTEETFITEVEKTTEEERDLQTTERFEMQREVGKTLQEDQKFNIGASISASYGPVKAEFSTGYETASSQENTAKSVANYARDVTERTAAKVTERVRTEQTIRTIEEFEEKNSHGFDNTQGSGNITGLYQWLTCIYQAQVYDYGIRLFFDIMVPEPAAFLLQALLEKAEVEGPKRPEPINFTPEFIAPQNYGRYVKEYQVRGVEPSPVPELTVAVTLKGPESDMSQVEDSDSSILSGAEFSATKEVAIPDGYKAIEAYVVASFNEVTFPPLLEIFSTAEPPKVKFEVFVGQHRISSGKTDDDGKPITDGGKPVTSRTIINQLVALNDEVKSIPIVVVAQNLTSYAIAVEIRCVRTPNAIAAWRLKTYEAIVEGYQKLESEYQEKLAEQAAQQGVVIEGRNPLENRMIERTELKRLSISMITGQHFGTFGSITTPPNASDPRIDFDEAMAEGRYARFFEEAFEWEQMTYELYPYYWGRKTTWIDRLLTQRLNRCYGEIEKEAGRMLSTGKVTIYYHAEPELNASDGRCQMLRSCTPNALENGCLLPQV